MTQTIPEGVQSIKVICYCKKEKEIYFPCPDEKLAMEQLEWLFRHLRDHNGMYHKTPFDLSVTTLDVDWKIDDGSTPQEGQDKG